MNRNLEKNRPGGQPAEGAAPREASRPEGCRAAQPLALRAHEAADTLGAIVASDRDRRALAWLRERAGDEAIREAVDQMPGQRRPYLSNVARALGLVLPASLARPPAGSAVRAEVARRLAALRARK